MGRETLETELAPLFEALRGADPGDAALAARLSVALPVDGLECTRVRTAARRGLDDGWLCDREAAGIRFSRPVKPSPATGNLSVDAVVMDRIAGPRHRHPNGEINLCFAEDGAPTFCGHGEGWVVFPPGSVHVPRVDGGKMLILYFLPGGAIEFQ